MLTTLRSRAVRRAATRLTVALVALVAVPAAAAHATVVATSPGNNEVVQASPQTVTIDFSEPVETAFGAVRVFNGVAERVDTGELSRPDGDSVAIGLKGDLPNGTYTVTYRVVSADTHPVSGAFVFHVGAAGRESRDVDRRGAEQRHADVGRARLRRDPLRRLRRAAPGRGRLGRAARLPARRAAARAAQALVGRRRVRGRARPARAGDDRPPGRGRGGILDRRRARLEHRVRGARNAVRPRRDRADAPRRAALRDRDRGAAACRRARGCTRRRRSSPPPGSF